MTFSDTPLGISAGDATVVFVEPPQDITSSTSLGVSGRLSAGVLGADCIKCGCCGVLGAVSVNGGIGSAIMAFIQLSMSVTT